MSITVNVRTLRSTGRNLGRGEMKERVHVCKLWDDGPDRDLSKSDNQHSCLQQHPPRHSTIIEGKMSGEDGNDERTRMAERKTCVCMSGSENNE